MSYANPIVNQNFEDSDNGDNAAAAPTTKYANTDQKVFEIYNNSRIVMKTKPKRGA